jgi:uncharacterized membrane protein YhaH (DUF805 family)
MTILFDKYLDGFRNYINFSGRTTRKDFWWFLVYDIIFTAGVIGLLELTIKGTSISFTKTQQEVPPIESTSIRGTSCLNIPFITENIRGESIAQFFSTDCT